MATRVIFQDPIYQFPNRYRLTDLGSGLYEIQSEPGTITQEGTLLSANNLNATSEEVVFHVVDTGTTANEFITSINNLTDYFIGLRIILKSNTTNTGACTINISDLGSKNIKKINLDGNKIDLQKDDIIKNKYELLVFDGTDFIISNPAADLSTVITDLEELIIKVNTIEKDLNTLKNKIVFFGTTSGSNNNYTINLSGITSLYAGLQINLLPNFNNTGNSTITINNLGAKLIKFNGSNLVGGEIKLNNIIKIIYDGVNFQLQPTSTQVADNKKNITETTNKLNNELDITQLVKTNISTGFNTLENISGGISNILEVKGNTIKNLLGYTGTQGHTITKSNFATFNISLDVGKTYTLNLEAITNTSSGEYGILGTIKYADDTFDFLTFGDNKGKNTGMLIDKLLINKEVKSIALSLHEGNLDTDSATIKNINLLEGDYTNYNISYFEGLKNVDKCYVKSVGKNLFNCNKVAKGRLSNIIGGDFKINDMPGYCTSELIKIKENTDLRIFGNVIWIVLYSIDKKVVRVVDKVNFTNTLSGESYIGFYSTGDEQNLSDVQLEYGTTATAYEPYKESYCNIRGIEGDNSLKRLANGVHDSMDNKGVITRRIGKIVLDGSLVYRDFKTYTNTVRVCYRNGNIKNSNEAIVNCISDKLDGVAKLYQTDVEGVMVGNALNNIWLRVNKDKLETPDLEGLKKWLQVNPITVYYELAEYTTENTNQVLSLNSFKDGSVYVDTDIPTTLDVQYPKNIVSRLATIETDVNNLSNVIRDNYITGTYSEFKNLKDNNLLISGSKYLLTDYRTKYIQPTTNTLKEMNIEELILTASSPNTFEPIVYSLRYPNDTIWYDFNNNVCEDNTTSRNGFIVRRLDTINSLDTPNDFRTITWARWTLDADNYYIKDNDNYNVTAYSVWTSGTADLNKLYKANNAIYYVISDTTTPSSATDSSVFQKIVDLNRAILYDDKIKLFGNIYFKTGNLVDTKTFGGDCINIEIKNKNNFLNNITIDNGSKNIEFGFNCSSMSIGQDSWNNVFGEACYNNIMLNNCDNNSFGNGCYKNSFGNDCDKNSFGNGCYGNSFSNSCFSNSFGNACVDNSFGKGCYSNSFGNSCGYNSFGNSCDYNSFGNSCSKNSFGNNCDFNSFGNSCDYNSLGNSCDYNSLGNYCFSNSFGAGTCYLLVKDLRNKNLTNLTDLIAKSYSITIEYAENGDFVYWYINRSRNIVINQIP
ncbi:hypothetical protein [Clostridium rectalis]|uniref:hypothetical protein n=1 Tax=Clostridium rectalis TaxID=2040295 RepID=UPI000F640BAF|nr:hypothetical protein [Clostridium rectalis]